MTTKLSIILESQRLRHLLETKQYTIRHFIDIYNFLIENSFIKEKQFAIHAEYRKVPHFILNLKVKRYQRPILNQYSGTTPNLNMPIDELILDELSHKFDLFNT